MVFVKGVLMEVKKIHEIETKTEKLLYSTSTNAKVDRFPAVLFTVYKYLYLLSAAAIEFPIPSRQLLVQS